MLRKIMRKTLSTLFYSLKVIIPEKGIIVLTYHRVNDNLEPGNMAISSRDFRKQMEYLYQHKYKVIGITEMIDTLRQPASCAKTVVITFDDGYQDNYLNAYPVLKEFGLPAIIFLTGEMIGKEGMLNWQEIKEMPKNGIDFGAHSISHPHLSQINVQEAKKEISNSKEIIHNELKLKDDEQIAFCYPYGDYDEEIRQLVKDAGFSCAFTVKPGMNKYGGDLFTLKRVEVNGIDSLFDFKKKLAGAYIPLHKLIQKLNTRYSIPNTKKYKINILYIIWSLELGGAERVVINLAKGLNKEKFNPVVCCLNKKGRFAEELEKEGIEVIALNKKGPFDLSIISKLVRVMKENQIDVVNTHLWGANFWGRIAAKKAKVPVTIATEHNTDVWKNWFHFACDRWLSRKTDKIIAVSNSVKEFYVSKGIAEDKVEVIYNGIDIKRGQAPSGTVPVLLREEFNIKDNDIVLSIIGRLVEQKGHRYLFEALKEILENRDSPHRGQSLFSIKLLVVGDGPLLESLKSQVSSLKLEDKVIFTGLRKDVKEILGMTDILVMPSLREGLPMVALEAMAAGVPIVATKVGGIPELVVDGQTGILIEPENIDALKDALIRIIEDKNLAQQLRNNAKKRVEEKFSLEKMLNKTQELYEKLYTGKIASLRSQ